MVMGTSADSGSDVARMGSGGLGVSGGRDVPARPLPAMRMTWKELHSAAKVLESVAEAQHHLRRHAETLTIHLMALQVGPCSNPRLERLQYQWWQPQLEAPPAFAQPGSAANPELTPA